MKNIFTLIFSLLCLYVYSQPTVNSCMDAGGQSLEVNLIPNAGFSGLVSNIQLTIKADDPSITFGAPTDILAYIPMAFAGGTTVSGGNAYQKFAGFGSLAMSAFGASWTAGQPITLFRISPSSMAANFEISADTWTTDNNGSFYVELASANQTGTICSSVFPVEGLQFQAKAMPDRSVELSWQTLSENQSAYFAVEKSADGTLFELIGQIEAAGYSVIPSDYHFVDRLPMTFETVYRLKQVDLDGNFSYSQLERIVWEDDFPSRLYPNPATGKTNMEFYAARPLKNTIANFQQARSDHETH